MQGEYDGVVTVGELRRYGDTGIGTFQGVNGEMIVLDGTVGKERELIYLPLLAVLRLDDARHVWTRYESTLHQHVIQQVNVLVEVGKHLPYLPVFLLAFSGIDDGRADGGLIHAFCPNIPFSLHYLSAPVS